VGEDFLRALFERLMRRAMDSVAIPQ
jgi:hypothetical protein